MRAHRDALAEIGYRVSARWINNAQAVAAGETAEAAQARFALARVVPNWSQRYVSRQCLGREQAALAELPRLLHH
jgi:hypothetical protein